jgi:hypothetical protein
MAEAYPTFLAGQRITASLLSSAQPQTARKTADTGRAATTTTAADPHLQFEVVANGVYVWWGWLKYDGPTAGDINIDFSTPTGALGEWMGHGVGIGRVVGATDVAAPAFSVDTASTTGYLQRMETNDVASARGFGAVTGVILTMDLKGTLRVGSTAGTFSLDWAQRVSDASTTTVYTDSWLTMLRVA